MADPSQIRSMTLPQLLGLWRSRNAESWQTRPELYTAITNQLLRLGEPLFAYDVLAEAMPLWPADGRLRQMQALALLRSGAADKAELILLELEREGNHDEETLGLLARIHKERWERGQGDPEWAATELALAHDYYRMAYDLAGGSWSGINVAAMALFSGRNQDAVTLARTVRENCERELAQGKVQETADYWLLATVAEASLILQDWTTAESSYRKAVEVGQGEYGDLVSTRHNALLILNHFGITDSIVNEILRIPSVIVFTGPLNDGTDPFASRISPDSEEALRREIRERLDKLTPGFGYASAVSVADVLFLEAMLERDAEINLVLPYDQEQFVEDRVEFHAGRDWKVRLENILENATEVIVASAHKMDGRGISSEYADRMLAGLAATRARQLKTELITIVAGDGDEAVDDSLGQVEHRGSIELIDLSKILEPAARNDSGAAIKPVKVTAPLHVPRIMSLLFADALHFSRLREDQIPHFLRHFLGMIGGVLARSAYRPVMKNTWGDGLFLVFQKVEDAGGFALELCDSINQTKWEENSLPAELNLRIGLHAGPVFECIDPISERQNFFGSHVSRAARIEPITPPGQVYASQAFAALAAADGSAGFVCDYVGQVPQAKGYGTFPTYHVHR